VHGLQVKVEALQMADEMIGDIFETGSVEVG
jgi:hypothetical protein